MQKEPFKLKIRETDGAYVYRGKGAYYDADIDKPAFLRHRLVKSIRFRRTDTAPCQILIAKY